MTCNKSSHNGPIEPGMVSFERLASSPVGNAQFPLFWRIKEPQKGIFLSSPWESRQILPQKVDGQKLLYLYRGRGDISELNWFGEECGGQEDHVIMCFYHEFLSIMSISTPC